MCPKAVELSLARGIVTFHEHVSSAQLVKKSEIEDGVIEADATRPKPPSFSSLHCYRAVLPTERLELAIHG